MPFILTQMLAENSAKIARELLVYFISHRQWHEAAELYQQEYGVTPAEAQSAVNALASDYGYRRGRYRSVTLVLGVVVAMTIMIANYALSNHSH